MSKKLHLDAIDYDAASPGIRAQCFDEVCELQTSLFDGRSRDYVANMLEGDQLRAIRLLMYRNDAGDAVGFNLIRRFEVEIDGITNCIFRSTVALKPEYRGRNSVTTASILTALRYRLRHPFQPVHFLGYLIIPATYYIFARYTSEIWPNYRLETPTPIYEKMKVLFASVGTTMGTVPGFPYLINYRSNVRDYESDTKRWYDHPRPEIQYYLRQNPLFNDGFALLTFVPLTWRNLSVAAFRFLVDKAMRPVARWRERVLALPRHN